MTKKIRVFGAVAILSLTLSSAFPSAQSGQAAPTSAATDDADFAAFVKKATTKPEFLSPLVDHLPKKAGVPTPTAMRQRPGGSGAPRL